MNIDCIHFLEKIPSPITQIGLENWIRNEAGSSNKDYFKCEKPGGLKLQQVPDEYSRVLIESLALRPQSYLEIGIGNGGSWMTFSHLNMKTLQVSHAVDNLSYYQAIDQKIEEIDFISKYLSTGIPDVKFYNESSDRYLSSCTQKYDIIFIDGDHSYEGVRKDYINSLPLINNGGMMIFHDINSIGAPGVVKFWNEFKPTHKHLEIINSNTCGMGLFLF
jgi:predicted O-methyltransferase YrrM